MGGTAEQPGLALLAYAALREWLGIGMVGAGVIVLAIRR